MPDVDEVNVETSDGVDAAESSFGENESVFEPTLDDLISSSMETPDGESEQTAQAEPTTSTYKVKVDGEDVEVGLDELLGGYQRQADYTRKTQALAADRERFTAFERLEQSLQVDPAATLQALAEAYGLPATGTLPAVEVQSDFSDSEDPLEREVAELRAWQTRQEAAENVRAEQSRIAAIDAEIDMVRTRFGDDTFDEHALLSFALDHRIGDLEMAYRSMRAVEAEKVSVAETNRIVAEKRALPPVEGGSSRATGSVRPGGSKLMSIEDALALALAD